MLFSTLHSSYETYVRTHITYFAFDLNDNSSTANAQTIDSATSQFFFFSTGRLSGIFISPSICLFVIGIHSMQG